MAIKPLSTLAIEHIRKVLGIQLDDSELFVYSAKRKIVPKSVDTFHRLAQALKLESVNNRGTSGDLWYYLKVPSQEGEIPDLWAVSLHQNQVEEFEQKYGKFYRK